MRGLGVTQSVQGLLCHHGDWSREPQHSHGSLAVHTCPCTLWRQREVSLWGLWASQASQVSKLQVQ